MASSYTSNSGIEKPAEGDQTGEWGDTVNTNMDIIDRSINGVGAITLSGTTHTLTTTDGTLSDGMYKVLVLGGSPSGTNTITISPNDQDKVYIVVNGSGQTATFTQGSGGNVSVLNGDSKIIYADGNGTGAAVVDVTADLSFSSVNIDGGTIDGTVIGGASAAAGTFTTVTASGEIDGASLDISGDADIDGTLEADAMTLNGTSITATATLSTGISNGNLPVFTSGVADDDFLRVAGTSIEGRSASEVLSDIGGQASLTFGISNTNAVKIDSASVADDEYARFTANGLESRSTAEVLSDIGGQASLTFGISNTNAVKIDSSSVADDEYARFTANGLESRSTAEVLSDIGGQASLTFGISNTNAVKIDSASVADDEYARFTANGLESRSTSEVLSDIGASAAAGSSSIVTTGALDAGSITSGFGTINNGSSAITTTGLISGGSLDIDDVVINGSTIGHTDDTDLITVANGVATVAGEVSMTTLDIGGTNVTSTAAELNILDGVTSTAAELNILDGVTSTAAELNYLDITTLGTTQASKAVTTDSNGDVVFPDGDKINLGTGSDLVLQHDGSHSYIQNSTGNLNLQGKSGEDSIVLAPDGAVTLYHDNVAKLATTSTGASITTSADTSSALSISRASGGGVVTIESYNAIGGIGTTDNIPFRFNTNNTERVRITNDGNVGIGATSPSKPLQVKQTAAGSGLSQTDIRATRDEYGADFSGYIDQGVGHGAIISSVDNGTATERVRITNAGKVGIGTTTAENPLTIQDIGGSTFNRDFAIRNGDATNYHRLVLGYNAASAASGVPTNAQFLLAEKGGGYGTSAGLVVGNSDNAPVMFTSNATERMRIASDGNIAIGTTGTGDNKLTVEGGVAATNGSSLALKSGGGANSRVADLAFYGTFVTPTSDTGHRRTADITSGYATGNWGNEYLAFGVGTGGGNDAAAVTTERMRIAGDGKVGIGTTAPDSLVEIASGGATTAKVSTSATNSYAEMIFEDGNAGYGFQVRSDGAQSISAGSMVINDRDTGSFPFVIKEGNATNTVVLSGSNTCFNSTAIGFANQRAVQIQTSSTGLIAIQHLNTEVSGAAYIWFTHNGNPIGSIVQNGTSGLTYNTSSDYRLKENVNYTFDATTRLKQLKPARFNFITDREKGTVDGFLAHEVQEVVPEAVTGEKDGEEMQGIDQSKLVPLLVKTIQELEARITALEAG